jgi:hypothetical protein
MAWALKLTVPEDEFRTTSVGGPRALPGECYPVKITTPKA